MDMNIGNKFFGIPYNKYVMYMPLASECKYSKKFKLFNDDGTVNTVGPGYANDASGNLVITTPQVYHSNVEQYLTKKRLREFKRKIMYRANLALFMENYGMKSDT